MIYTTNYCLKLGSCYFAMCVDACILFFLDQFSHHTGWVAFLAISDVLCLLSAGIAGVFSLRWLLLPPMISRIALLVFMSLFSSFTVIVATGFARSLPIFSEHQRKIEDYPVIVVACLLFDVLLVVELAVFFKTWRFLGSQLKDDGQPVLDVTPPSSPFYTNLELCPSSPRQTTHTEMVKKLLTFTDPRGIPIYFF